MRPARTPSPLSMHIQESGTRRFANTSGSHIGQDHIGNVGQRFASQQTQTDMQSLAVPARSPQSRSSSAPTRGNISGRSTGGNGCQQQGAMSTVSAIEPSRSPSPFDFHTPQPAAIVFPDANKFNIGRQNIHVGDNVQQAAPSRTVFELLEPYISHGAAYNSAERCDAPRCSPETREAIQGEVVALIRDGDVYEPSKRMAWLGGPAGAGKTAIAGSVAATCAKLRLLAGTFFFSSVQGSGDTRRTKCYVVTTLAYQLAQHKTLHEYKVQLLVAIEGNPDIFHKSLVEQARCLILGPLGAIHGKCDTSRWPRGILYDGLDEVKAVQYHDSTREDLTRKDDDDQLEILQVLHTLTNSPVFPFRIFIASRPELIITKFFKSTAFASTVLLFLDSKYKPDADIKRFLQSKFAIIRNESGMSNPSWPGEEVINQLVENVFWAEQLEDIMRVAQGTRLGETRTPSPCLMLSYTHIINRSPNPQLAVIWIRHMITGHGRAVLPPPEKLVSLLSVPPLDDHRSPIEIYHKTLTDFLTSKDRCGDLYVRMKSLDEFVARRYVVILQSCGPKVPLASPDELSKFLNKLLSSSLFQDYVGRFDMNPRFKLLLRHLCEPSISALAACDVAWWTRSMSVRHRDLLQAMYCYIHSALCCRIHTGANGACLPACIHWREGILAEARALGWCVHKLEEVPLKKLSRMSTEEFDPKFREFSGSKRCTICQPTINGQDGSAVELVTRKASSKPAELSQTMSTQGTHDSHSYPTWTPA
ncbi:hypothetical protein NMY22_g19591 [Coprinellus aureogranulatus]|nr:hypothetical protein NMY22_g19591 [Coprinellus aureogranulatus]